MPATYEPINTQTLGTATLAVSFSSIPQTYTDLIVVSNMGLTSIDGSGLITFNDDTATNYSYTSVYGGGASASSYRYSSRAYIFLNGSIGAGSAVDTNVLTHIQNYSNTTTYKTVIGRANRASTSGSYMGTEASIGLWRSTSAITKITLTGQTNFIIGSTFTLYGIKAA